MTNLKALPVSKTEEKKTVTSNTGPKTKGKKQTNQNKSRGV